MRRIVRRLVTARRRPGVWAVATDPVPAEPVLRDIGVVPTTSLRWVARRGPATLSLYEDRTP